MRTQFELIKVETKSKFTYEIVEVDSFNNKRDTKEKIERLHEEPDKEYLKRAENHFDRFIKRQQETRDYWKSKLNPKVIKSKTLYDL